LYPSDEVDQSLLELHPAMSLRASVSFVKSVPAGSGIGYGMSYITKSPARIATVPVGYADGYSRSLSNRGFVLIHGKRAPIVGRICMDQFMVDVTHIPDVKVGDVVTLLGKDKGAEISAEELSGWAGSFNYELICDVSKRVPRVYYYQEKKVGTLDYYNCEKSVFDLRL
jgi:alanine racemase